ncbi:hypothetical protein [Longitalea luteola]|uniref:hypothetical protein n=1 Tax=Longitalea luteola TaxID=2812563 RepID=UPI001A963CEA|nr:hypothetical protein [Longitalea luteola]
MKWKKLGLVYAPEKNLWWNQLYAILPTPFYLKDQGIIRVYFATTCAERYGRITYVDVDANNPTEIVNNPHEFIIDIGQPGAFDDCGVNVSSVIEYNDNIYLYYAGYQRHSRTPYSILSGLAIGDDHHLFKRYSSVPVLERTDTELDLRSAPTVIYEDGKFKMWYVAGMGWKHVEGEVHKNKFMPVYQLKYGESEDGKKWNVESEPVFKLEKDEFGFGRPFIYKKADNIYQLYYSIRRSSRSYRIGFAESEDGRLWTRKDNEIGIDVSSSGWDAEMICYPAVISAQGKTYMFYNGNNNGETGFGVAELINE